MKTNEARLNSIIQYVKENYIAEEKLLRKSCVIKETETIDNLEYSLFTPSQIANIKKQSSNTWQRALFNHIDRKEMSEVEVYKRAYISKKTFSKIRCNSSYQPDKDTSIKMCIGLKLNIDETLDLMSLAGHTLSRSLERDLVVRFFIEHRIYNIDEINYALYDMDLKLLPIPQMD